LREPLVVDSTCLIALEWIGHLEILPALFASVHAPPEVEREFGSSLPWLRIEEPFDKALLAALKLLVDDGEAEALTLAVEKGSRIALDDLHARTVALKMKVRITGTLGILVNAKREGIIPWVKPLLDDLDRRGFRMSPALKAEALRLAGE
jgi:predicted nucleic acid-binding protein